MTATVTAIDAPWPLAEAGVAPTRKWHPTMLLISTTDRDVAEQALPHLRFLPVLGAVVRRVVPTLVEATFIPALLVYTFLAVGNLFLAMVSALSWTYGVLAWRKLTQRAIPGVLVLAAIGLTVRTVVALAAGNAVVYFLQPIATTLVLACLFFGSLLSRRPMIARLAVDFCPLAPDVAASPAVMRLFRGLTAVWGTVHLATATATFTLLISLPTATFVAVKTFACVAISSCAVVITVARAVQTARREGLAFVPADMAPADAAI